MKTFKNWLNEDAPANGIGGGFGVRGMGHVSGHADGASPGYTTNNIADQSARSDAHSSFVDQWHNDLHNTASMVDGGDSDDSSDSEDGSISTRTIGDTDDKNGRGGIGPRTGRSSRQRDSSK